MPVIALANQKGGVAKTTTALSLGAAWAALGDRVLLVDCDPQAALTFSMGVDPEDLEVSLHDVLMGRAAIKSILWEAHGCHVAAATLDLAGAEAFLLTKTGREFALRRALETVRHEYDVVVLDCPPSLGILTINALTAADEVVIPLQCESLSQRGMNHLLETIEDVRAFTNPGLRIRGVIATMFDPRTRHTQAVLASVTENYGLPLLEPPVRKSIRFAEAPAAGETIFERGPDTPGATAYRQIAGRLRTWAAAPGPVPDSAMPAGAGGPHSDLVGSATTIDLTAAPAVPGPPPSGNA